MSRPLLSPLPSTSSKEYRGDVCMLCSKPCKEERRDLNSWNNLKCIAESWKYIEPYGKLYDDTNWDSGPSGHFIHKLCRLKVSTKSLLERNKRKQQEESWRLENENTTTLEIIDDTPCKSRKRRYDSGIPLQSPDLCIFCQKAEDNRHPD